MLKDMKILAQDRSGRDLRAGDLVDLQQVLKEFNNNYENQYGGYWYVERKSNYGQSRLVSINPDIVTQNGHLVGRGVDLETHRWANRLSTMPTLNAWAILQQLQTAYTALSSTG